MVMECCHEAKSATDFQRFFSSFIRENPCKSVADFFLTLGKGLLQHAIIQLFLTPIRSRLNKRQYERMWVFWCGSQLRLEQGSDVKPVRRRLNRPRLTALATRDDRKSSLHRRPLKLRIHFEVTEKFFSDRLLPIKCLQIRSRTQTNFWNDSRKLGRITFAIRYSAGHRINNYVLGARVIFRSIGVF